jgi:hypothetical protein
MKLERWCILARHEAAFQAPDEDPRRLHGVVNGHHRLADGAEVTTSLIVARNGEKVVTKSGSEYDLGAIDSTYKSLYPEAKKRLLASLPERVPYNTEAPGPTDHGGVSGQFSI